MQIISYIFIIIKHIHVSSQLFQKLLMLKVRLSLGTICTMKARNVVMQRKLNKWCNSILFFFFKFLLADLLKKSSPSRVINVSSIVYSMGSIAFDNLNAEKSYSSFPLYNHTKLANILFTRELSRRLEGTGESPMHGGGGGGGSLFT